MSMSKINWISGAIKRPGAFTAAAKKRGMSTKEFSAKVAKNPNEYSVRLQKQAVLARTLRGMNKKK